MLIVDAVLCSSCKATARHTNIDFLRFFLVIPFVKMDNPPSRICGWFNQRRPAAAIRLLQLSCLLRRPAVRHICGFEPYWTEC